MRGSSPEGQQRLRLGIVAGQCTAPPDRFLSLRKIPLTTCSLWFINYVQCSSAWGCRERFTGEGVAMSVRLSSMLALVVAASSAIGCASGSAGEYAPGIA